MRTILLTGTDRLIAGCGRLQPSCAWYPTGKSCTTNCMAKNDELRTTNSLRTFALRRWVARWRLIAVTLAPRRRSSLLRVQSTLATSKNTDVSCACFDYWAVMRWTDVVVTVGIMCLWVLFAHNATKSAWKTADRAANFFCSLNSCVSTCTNFVTLTN